MNDAKPTEWRVRVVYRVYREHPSGRVEVACYADSWSVAARIRKRLEKGGVVTEEEKE